MYSGQTEGHWRSDRQDSRLDRRKRGQTTPVQRVLAPSGLTGLGWRSDRWESPGALGELTGDDFGDIWSGDLDLEHHIDFLYRIEQHAYAEIDQNSAIASNSSRTHELQTRSSKFKIQPSKRWIHAMGV